MRYHKAQAWERKLKFIFDEIDKELETKYKNQFNLHPARPPEGKTSNPEMDGLFNVGASFSAGFGSSLGPGYVVDIRLSTLDKIPEAIHETLRKYIQGRLQEKLPNAFPGKDLRVEREENHLRIIGDLSLDT